jgi:hypothetical protein
MLEASSRVHLLMPVSNKRRRMLRKGRGPWHARYGMLVDEVVGIQDSWFKGEVRSEDKGLGW